MDKVIPGYEGNSHFPPCASSCYACLAVTTLDVELVCSISLKSACLGQEEPQFSFQGWAGAVSAQPLEAFQMQVIPSLVTVWPFEWGLTGSTRSSVR